MHRNLNKQNWSGQCRGRSFSLQILWNSSRWHGVFMLISLSSMTNLTLLCGFCAAMHPITQVPPNEVVDSCNCCCHLFGACTVDVTVCFSHQAVSPLNTGLSRHFSQATPCWLHLSYFGKKNGCWRNSCHSNPPLLLIIPELYFVFFVRDLIKRRVKEVLI